MLHVNNYNDSILKNINFHLQDGENLIVLGSNGAGKSTLAKVICSIIKSNNIKLFGKDLHLLNTKERVRLINYIPPKLEIFDEFISLKEYLSLSKLYSKVSIDEIIPMLNLTPLEQKTCHMLSSGEQQLLLIASSILHNAKLSIFDEPTANLDPQKTLKVYNLLKSDIFKNKIIITHDLNLAYKLGYKILYMQNGKVVFFDTNQNFFNAKNLNKFFGSSLKRVDDYFMVNL